MARKPAPNGSAPSPSSPELSARPLGPLSVLADKEKLKQREEDVTKINNMNASDLKNACDDALKRVRLTRVYRPGLLRPPIHSQETDLSPPQFLSHPELFQPNFIHTDVRLALGWASVFVAFGTGLYGWKIDFERSKPVVWAGVILYVRFPAPATTHLRMLNDPLFSPLQVCYFESRADTLCVFY